jgi:hypothetical protein
MKKKKKEKEKEKRKIIYFYDAFGVIGKPTIQSFCNSSLGVSNKLDTRELCNISRFVTVGVSYKLLECTL